MNNFLLSNSNIKVKSTIISVIIVLSEYLLTYIFNINFYNYIWIIIIFTYMFVFSLINFKSSVYEILSLLSFPIIYIFSFSFFIFKILFPILHFGILSFIGINLSFILFGIILYAIFINISIIHASFIEDVPLAQFTYTINYILSLVVGYIFFSFVVFGGIKWFPLDIFYGFLGGAIITSQIMWGLEYALQDIILYSVISGFILMFSSFVLLFYPTLIFIKALFLSVVLYIYNGLMIHNIKGSLKKHIFVEYIIMLIIISLFLIFFTSWGIAGGI